MLVLSRKEGEAVVVADEIEIVLLEIRGNRVLLGFNAPREIPIVRTECIEAETVAARDAGT